MITKEQVERIALLARIELTEQEKERFPREFSQILEYFETLKQVDTKDIFPMTHSVLLENVSREDTATEPSLELVERLLAQVPALKNGFVKVKKILS